VEYNKGRAEIIATVITHASFRPEVQADTV